MALFMVTTTMDKAGRLVLPKAIRDELQLRAGDTLAIEVSGEQVNIRVIAPEPQLRREGRFWVWHGAGPVTNADVRELVQRTRGQRSRRVADRRG
jgi:AbrB family looped-hinge helix DNA binding protein